MKHLYYTFSSFILEIGYCFKKNFQYHGTDKLKELTVLSDLLPRHMLTLIWGESKPSLGCESGISEVSPFLSGH